MRQRLSSFARRPRPLAAVLALLAAGGLTAVAPASGQVPTSAATAGTVLQTNLVSDLAGAAGVTDPDLVNPWGISESTGSPFWISDNNSGLSTLYEVPGAGKTPVSINPLAVSIPTPAALTGGAPDGTVFNTASGRRRLPDHGPEQGRSDHVRPGGVPVRHRGRDDHRLESRNRSHRNVQRPHRG